MQSLDIGTNERVTMTVSCFPNHVHMSHLVGRWKCGMLVKGTYKYNPHNLWKLNELEDKLVGIELHIKRQNTVKPSN